MSTVPRHNHTPESTSPDRPAAPRVVDRETWQREHDTMLVREKEHTRAADALAAARRRLPMTEVPDAQLTGADGPVRLSDLFEGRDQLISYHHMFFTGKLWKDQCPGCTMTAWDLPDPLYLEERGVSFAMLCEGPWAEVAAFHAFMGHERPWFSTYGADGDALPPRGGFACYLHRDGRIYLTYRTTDRGTEQVGGTLAMLDMTVYGRQEDWEDSPDGWPQGPAYEFWSRDGRPTAQWTRPGVSTS